MKFVLVMWMLSGANGDKLAFKQVGNLGSAEACETIAQKLGDKIEGYACVEQAPKGK